MKIQKYNIILSISICIISLIVALILSEFSYSFWSNIFIGIFSSGILTLLLSIAAYRIERKNALEAFYSSVLEVVNNFNIYEYKDDLEKTMNIVLKMNEFNYKDLDMSYGNIDFLLTYKKQREYIYNNIYSKITNIRKIISEKAFHFKEYNKASNGNLRVMKHFVEEIDDKFMFRSVEEVFNEEGENHKIAYVYNKLTVEILEELNGKYYDLMYR